MVARPVDDNNILSWLRKAKRQTVRSQSANANWARYPKLCPPTGANPDTCYAVPTNVHVCGFQ
jgi:hypothetical protein